MPGQRNPLREGTRFVTQRFAGSGTQAAAGTAYTFSAVRNIRRIVKVQQDLATAFAAGGDMYRVVVLSNDGQSNIRTLVIIGLDYDTMAESAASGNLSAINFIATMELAEGP